MDTDNCEHTGAENDYFPIWLGSPRGFRDHSVLEAQAFNELLSCHLQPTVKLWSCSEDGWIFDLPFTTISVDNDADGTLSVQASSDVMPRKYLDGMRASLRLILERIDDSLDWHAQNIAILILQLVEEAVSWQLAWKTSKQARTQSIAVRSLRTPSRIGEIERRKIPAGVGQGYMAGTNYKLVMGDPCGVNLRTIEDTALSLLGKPIEKICSNIGSEFRILHVEPVFRDDLVARFLERQEEILGDLRGMSYSALRQSVHRDIIPPNSREDTREGLAAYLAKPRVTFHGSTRRAIESIVRYGFVMPGAPIGKTGYTLAVRCGMTYGMGIYSSPDAHFASSYLDMGPGDLKLTCPSAVSGMRLIVCAPLMGRPVAVTSTEARGKETVIASAAHSHVSGDDFQYVVFDSRSIIPCYVLHLDFGAEAAKREFERLATNPTAYFEQRKKTRKKEDKDWNDWMNLCPGDTQRKKDALKAAAAKWFPYGFGPAKGTNFVIEAMAEVSDDEELYGDFQEQRIEYEHEWEARPTSKRDWFDEYQTVRRTNAELVGQG